MLVHKNILDSFMNDEMLRSEDAGHENVNNAAGGKGIFLALGRSYIK